MRERVTMEENNQSKNDSKGSPLLELYIQRNLLNKVKHIDEETLANALKTLLHQDKEISKHLN